MFCRCFLNNETCDPVPLRAEGGQKAVIPCNPNGDQLLPHGGLALRKRFHRGVYSHAYGISDLCFFRKLMSDLYGGSVRLHN
jgi:hypothetical protein